MIKKRICLLSHVFAGGFKAFTLNLYSLLEKSGYDVMILFLRKIPNPPKDFKNSCVDVINTAKRVLPPFLLRKLIKKIGTHLSKNKTKKQSYDIFRSQIKSAKKVKQCSKEIDLTMFDCVISTEEMFCTYFLADKVKANKKIAFIHPDYKMALFDRAVDKRFFKKIDFLFAVSDSGKNSLESSFPNFQGTIIGMRNALNTNDILKKSIEYKCEFNHDILNIITVCRLDNKSKALDRMLNIVLSLATGGYKFVWRVIGTGDYKETMEKFILEHDLSKYLILLDYIENPIPYVKASDLFVLQSYYEGYPMVVVESMIVQTPVLITNYPSAQEQVKNGKTGFIVNNDFNAILDKIKYILDNQIVLSDIKENIKKINLDNFENIVKLENVINEKTER